MKNLNPNERKLLWFFLSAVAVAAVLFGGKLVLETHRSLESKLADLREQHDANAQWLSEKPMWDARAQWMEENVAPAAPMESAASDLLTKLQATVTARGGKILEQGFSPPSREGNFDTATVHLKISGPFPALAKWLFDTQQPEAYISVKKITFKSDGAPPQIVCDLEVTQYFHGI